EEGDEAAEDEGEDEHGSGYPPCDTVDLAETLEGGTADHGDEAPAGEDEHAAGPALALAAESGGGHGDEGTAGPVINQWTWFTWGGTEFHLAMHLDGLSAMMLFVVTLVSLLVHIYSTEYLKGDRRFTHYYAFLSLFTASMLFYVDRKSTPL